MRPFVVIGIVLVGAIAFFLGTDPQKMSIGSGQKEFRPQYVAPPSVDPYKGFPRDDANKLQDAEIKWRGEFFGPESLTFDLQGRGPYTGLSDGRVLRYDGPELGWTTFAYTSTNRSEVCAPKSPVAPNLAFEHVCGRPLGLRFNKRTGDLWIADAYFGIMKVGPEGGQAEVVLDEIDGKPLLFTNDLDFDEEGILYFTDSSTKWQRKVFLLSILEGDVTGRFIKFNPNTKESKILIDNLGFPNGVAISKDGSFVLVAETLKARVHRYWLKGEKAGTNEVFVDLPGWPDNVRCNEAGDFWVAIHARRMKTQDFLNVQPWLRALIVRLPIPTKFVYGLLIGKPHGMVIRLSPDGKVQEVLEDQEGKVVKLVSEVEEHDGKLYLGSVLMPHVAVYTLPSRSSSSNS